MPYFIPSILAVGPFLRRSPPIGALESRSVAKCVKKPDPVFSRLRKVAVASCASRADRSAGCDRQIASSTACSSGVNIDSILCLAARKSRSLHSASHSLLEWEAPVGMTILSKTIFLTGYSNCKSPMASPTSPEDAYDSRTARTKSASNPYAVAYSPGFSSVTARPGKISVSK